MSVIFASVKPIDRAPNIKTLFNAYDGDKTFVQTDGYRHHQDITSGDYSLLVIDEFPTESPGKAINVGHGIPAVKFGGLDMARPYVSKENTKLLTYAVTSSEGLVSVRARQCGLPEYRVLPYGLPRTDMLIGKKKGDGGTVLSRKTAYLYAPTWRAPGETSMPYIDWKWLNDQLHDDEVMIVKPHPMTFNILEHDYDRIVELPSTLIIDPYLIDCDVIVTDYSSVMFEAYLLDKPVILFEKIKGYTKTRGTYFKYPDEYCSRYCTNERELLRMLREARSMNELDKYIRNRFASACDGHATERLLDIIRRIK